MTDHKRAIFPEGGPKPAGPYSPGIASGGYLFVAGQVGLDPATGQPAGDTIEAQTLQVMEEHRQRSRSRRVRLQGRGEDQRLPYQA